MQGDLQLLPELLNAGGTSGSCDTTAVLGWSRARVKTPFPGHGAPCPSPGRSLGRKPGMSFGRQGGAELLKDLHSTRDGGGGFMAGPWEKLGNVVITAQLWKLGTLHHPVPKKQDLHPGETQDTVPKGKTSPVETGPAP